VYDPVLSKNLCALFIVFSLLEINLVDKRLGPIVLPNKNPDISPK
jgi:hypothetical protein